LFDVWTAFEGQKMNCGCNAARIGECLVLVFKMDGKHSHIGQ